MAQTLEAVQEDTDSRIPFSDLARQNASIQNELEAAVKRVVQDSSFVLGKAVASFERAFSDYCEADSAVGCNSGTSAIHLALASLGIGQGDEVITVSHTFVGTVWGILYCGATPVFADIDPQTMTIDVARVEALITDRTRVILPVHLYGHPVDMDPLMELAKKHDLYVIEDAAQAHGARYKGRRAGSLGHMACFSFYPGKNLGAWGEGGAVVTSDPELEQHLRRLRDHGQAQRYHHEELGFNYRMDGIQGAVLETKLKYLDTWNARRQEIASCYRRSLSGVSDISLPVAQSWAESVYHLFVIRSSDRDSLQKSLDEQGIDTGLHYPVPVHEQIALNSVCGDSSGLPETESAARQCLSLPLYPEMSDNQVERVCGAVKLAV